MRRTSIETYREIRDSGLLSRIRLLVLEEIANIDQPFTAKMVEKRMNTFHNIRGSWKTLSYLRDVGVIEEIGETKCPISGRNVIQWQMTGELPVTPTRELKPRNLNKCIDYILDHMSDNSIMSLTRRDLINLKS